MGSICLLQVGVTDDGTLIVWDLQSLRFKSEDHYRKHYEGVPKRAQQVSGFFSRRRSTGLHLLLSQVIIQKKRPMPKGTLTNTGGFGDDNSMQSGGKVRMGSPSVRERRKQRSPTTR